MWKDMNKGMVQKQVQKLMTYKNRKGKDFYQNSSCTKTKSKDRLSNQTIKITKTLWRKKENS